MVEDPTIKKKVTTKNGYAPKVLQDLVNDGNESQFFNKKNSPSSNIATSTFASEFVWTEAGKRPKRKIEEVLPAAKKPRSEQDELEELEDELFEWPKYLQETSATTVPKEIFKHVVPDCMCGFESGMKLEVPNNDYPNCYWLATIITKAPPLILVRYEGFQEENDSDFWCNTLSDDIHPVGWCAKMKKPLKPPKAIQHKETNWYSYLIKNLTGARKASEHLFLKKSHPAHYLRIGQYVEVLDHLNTTCYWLARINDVYSGRLSLSYEGSDPKKEPLWCYYLEETLRPIGHGIKHGLTLYPPRGMGPFTHLQFSRITEKIVSLAKQSDNNLFQSLFVGWPTPKEHGVKLGMKLEAVHPGDPSTICVASVSRVYDKYYFLVKIDNLISAQDEDHLDSFICHKDHQKVFPVGFCQTHGLILLQPRGYNGKFTWDSYLKYTKADPVPDSFFGTVKEEELVTVGMKLEAVDQEHPSNICVASITQIVGRHIWLHIDGDSRDDQISSLDSHDIFPPGWCESTGHELQWPRPDTLEQKDRISRLRHTATRQTRLEVLRKGKLHKSSATIIDIDGKGKDKDATPKEKARQKAGKYQGRHRYTKKRIIYDNEIDKEGMTDVSVAIVNINKLSEGFNTEESIKHYFHLDEKGRLPTQVVTIDDDDDDEEEEKVKTEKEDESSKKFSETDLDFFSFMRVRPKTMTSSEEEVYQQKLIEHDANRGAPTSPPATSKEKKSLKSVVAMLRANKQPTRSQLLEQYKENKEKNRREKKQPSTSTVKCTISSNNKENDIIEIPASSILNNSARRDSNPSSHNLINVNQPIDIPGKGEYKVLEKIITKQGDKNKIILKLGRPDKAPTDNVPTSVSSPQPVTPKTPTNHYTPPIPAGPSTPTVNNDVNLEQLSNMARTHPGIDEIMRNRCNKVRALCKQLPKNPLQWNRTDVAKFVQNAEFGKYATLFYNQEVDGHAFLLLTANEIHNVLAVPLGPAVKLHDYIFTLQQLVNDAYLHSKKKKMQKK